VRSTSVILAAVVLLSLAAPRRAARADGLRSTIVVESYVGVRPANAERIMAPLRAELEARGFVADPTVLAMRLETSVARPGLVDESLTKNALSQMFENGLRAWNMGDEDAALGKLESAISTAMRNPDLLSRVGRLRDQLFQGYLILSLAQRRRGQGPRSEVSMGELIRTFPDRTLGLDEAGPEANDLYRFVSADLARSKLGALSVYISDPTSVVFVNEVLRQSASGNVVLQEMLPGTYRVLVRSLDISERVRVYSVPVYPDRLTKLGIDWDLDSVLAVDKWVGFQFGTSNEQAGERDLAVKVGLAAKSALVVTINLSRVRSGYRLVAKRYETLTGAQMDWCQVDLTGADRKAFSLLADCVKGEDNRTRVRANAPASELGLPRFEGYLRVEPLSPPSVAVRPEPADAPPARKKSRGAGKWIWGATSLAAFAAGGVLLYLDGKTPCDGPSSKCPTSYATGTPGLVLLGAGAAALSVSAVLFFVEPTAPAPRSFSASSIPKSWVAGVSLQW
jgi:hypothetical protein